VNSKHTPTPWHVVDKPDSDWLDVESEHMGVCRLPRDRFASGDAAMIVRAVNAHDDLVAALRNLLHEARHFGNPEMDVAKDAAEAALAKAEGGAA